MHSQECCRETLASSGSLDSDCREDLEPHIKCVNHLRVTPTNSMKHNYCMLCAPQSWGKWLPNHCGKGPGYILLKIFAFIYNYYQLLHQTELSEQFYAGRHIYSDPYRLNHLCHSIFFFFSVNWPCFVPTKEYYNWFTCWFSFSSLSRQCVLFWPPSPIITSSGHLD